MREVPTYCRICAAACGIVVTLDGDRVQRVRGDAEHPASRGYTCPKGRALAAWHHAPERLDHPILRGERATWDVVLADLAGVIAAARADGGPDAVAGYLATGMAYDINGWMTAERLLRRLGTRQRYTPVTVDNAAVLRAAELVTGTSALNTVWDPERSDLLLLFGTNPVVSHGYGTTLADPVVRLRDFRAAGGSVWVVDPRRTETAALADHHLGSRPGSDHLILAWLVRELLEDGADPDELGDACDPSEVDAVRAAVAGFTLDRVATAADVGADDLRALRDAVRRADGLAVMCGTGVTMGRAGTVCEWLRWVLLVLTGSIDRDRGMVCNPGWLHPLDGGSLATRRPEAPAVPGPASRPELAHWQGQHPCVSLVDEIEHGTVRVLVVAGGNPLTAFPEPERTGRALARLDALVVLDVVETSLTRVATHVLPVAGQLERADVSMLENVSFGGRVQYTPAVVPVGAARRPAWWVLGELARRLDLDVLHGMDPAECDDDTLLARLAAGSRGGLDELVAAGPSGVTAPAAPGWVRRRILPGGRWRLAPEGVLHDLARAVDPGPGLVLVPRRRVRWMNSAPDRGRVPDDPARVHLHPTRCDEAGLADGDTVTVVSTSGTMTGVLCRDPNVTPDAVACTHGAWESNVGRLTSTRDGVDRDTGMPVTSGVQVRVEAAAAGSGVAGASGSGSS